MHIWFNTDAFIEYIQYIKVLSDRFKVKEYLLFRQKFSNINYHSFLLLNYNNFFIRLITCPSCIGVWLNLITAIFYSNKMLFFSNFTVNILLYYIISILKHKYDRASNL